MNETVRVRFLYVAIAVGLLLGACSPTSSDSPSTTRAAETTEQPTTTTTSVATTTSTTTTSTTTAAPAFEGTREELAAAIEATFDRGPVGFQVLTIHHRPLPALEIMAAGVHDAAQGTTSVEVAVEGATAPTVLEQLARSGFLPDLIEFLYTPDGLLTRQDGLDAWVSTSDRAVAPISRHLGVSLPGSSTIPGVGVLLDEIVSDTSRILSISAAAGAAGRTEFTLTVEPATALRTLLPHAYHGGIDAASDLGGSFPVRISLNSLGYVREVSLEAEHRTELIREIVNEVDGADTLEGVRNYVVAAALSGPAPALGAPHGPFDFVDTMDFRGRPGTCYGRALSVQLGALGFACDRLHQFEVFGSHIAPFDGAYAGDDAVFGYADLVCSSRSFGYTDLPDAPIFVIYPAEATWAMGDRLIICGYEFDDSQRESIRTVPPSVVGSFVLRPGLCVEQAGALDEGGAVVDTVSCSQEHFIEIFGELILGDLLMEFPGDDALQEETLSYCRRLAAELDIPLTQFVSTLAPEEASFEFGDRQGLCVVEWDEPVAFSVLDR